MFRNKRADLQFGGMIKEPAMENAVTAQHDRGPWMEAAQEDDALQRFADRYGISLNRAKTLVARFGNDRATLYDEAAKLERER